MMRKESLFKVLAVAGVTAMLVIPFAATDWAVSTAAASSKKLAAGSTWVVEKTTALSKLTIAKDASVKAPEGSSITMTVDGIGTPIAAGEYKGKIVLTVTKEIKMSGAAGGGGGAPGGGGGDGCGVGAAGVADGRAENAGGEGGDGGIAADQGGGDVAAAGGDCRDQVARDPGRAGHGGSEPVVVAGETAGGHRRSASAGGGRGEGGGGAGKPV